MRWAMMNFVVSGISVRSAARILASVLVSTAEVESSRDQNFRLFQQRPGNTQPLLLAAGDIRTALLDVGVVFVRHLLDKLIRAGQFAGALQLRICRIRVAPAQIFLDCAGEEHVFLEDDRDLIAERFKIVLAHVTPADPHTAARHIIQTADQLHQRGLAPSRCHR